MNKLIKNILFALYLLTLPLSLFLFYFKFYTAPILLYLFPSFYTPQLTRQSIYFMGCLVNTNDLDV